MHPKSLFSLLSRHGCNTLSRILFWPSRATSSHITLAYTSLSKTTVKDIHYIPRTDECLESLGDAEAFFTFHANWKSWQIDTHQNDNPLTVIIFSQGCFRSSIVPFGLCITEAAFERTKNIDLAGFRWKSWLVHLDGLTVFWILYIFNLVYRCYTSQEGLRSPSNYKHDDY